MRSSPEAVWRRSSHCSANSCVEIALLGIRVAVRDSKEKNGPMLMFTQAEWNAFLEGARNGEFNLTSRRS
jgi:Domain of unknown function (DUF397)